MLTDSPITNQPAGKTFGIAIGALGLGAILQLVLIAAAVIKGVHPWEEIAKAPPLNPELTQVAGNPPPASISVDLQANALTEPPQTQTTTPTSTVPPRPTPVTGRATPTEPANYFEELIGLGKQLRDRGDMSSAITKFKEAAANDTKSPIPLNELATTYDKMGLADKAAENWRKIYEMGDAAGIYFQLAESKIKTAQVNALRNVEKTTPPPAAETPPDTSGAIDGIAAGATLGLLQVTTEDLRDENAAKHFTLHIPIKARPKAHIDVKDLVLHILFYDIVDNQNVVQTSANVNFRWATPPADWVDSDTEELTVDYLLPKPEARAARKENRKYFGYIVRIYYKQQLQAATAQPERLAQQYPAPPTLQKESDKQ